MAALIAKPRLFPFPPVSFIATGLPVKAHIIDVNMLKKKSLVKSAGLFVWALEAEIQRNRHLLWMLCEQVQSNM